MTRIVAVAPALPPHRYSQQEITDSFADWVLDSDDRRALLHRLHTSAGVRTRHLALPLPRYADLGGFGPANDAFIEVGLDLAQEAIEAALKSAGLTPGDVDVILATSVTGVAAPSLDARLVDRLGMRGDVKRIPVFGLGCVAGAAGVARLHDYLVGHRDEVALLLSVELCSLTVQHDDDSTANLVASGLFGDGAAAVVLVGADRAADLGLPGPDVVATRSRLYPETSRVMGWDIGGTGFRIVLDARVPEVVRAHLADDVTGFLRGHGLAASDVQRWVAHPGGPKVLEAVQDSLDLPPGALDVTWRSLAAVGNLSSSSVLHVLGETLAAPPPPPGSAGLMLAMGPGFCSELVLLHWADDVASADGGASAAGVVPG